MQPYLISWFRYQPNIEIARLQVPVLLIQGTTDIQVDTGQVRMLKNALPSAELMIVPGMNLMLKSIAVTDPAQQVASYSDSALAIVPAVPDTIAHS